MFHKEEGDAIREVLEERDGLLKAAAVNGAALRMLQEEIDHLKGDRIRMGAAMIRAMDALESDAKPENRRGAWELLQAQFDDVEEEEHLKMEALRNKLDK